MQRFSFFKTYLVISSATSNLVLLFTSMQSKRSPEVWQIPLETSCVVIKSFKRCWIFAERDKNKSSEKRFRSSLSYGACFMSLHYYSEDFHRIFLLNRKLLFREILFMFMVHSHENVRSFDLKITPKYSKNPFKFPWHFLLQTVSQL